MDGHLGALCHPDQAGFFYLADQDIDIDSPERSTGLRLGPW